MTDIFLGMPPPNVAEWIIEHSQPSGHADTWYKYANDTEWRTVSITGMIEGHFDDDAGEGIPTTQIPDITNVVALEIGTAVTSIRNYAFSLCDKLTSVTIPDSVTIIDNSAFFFCSGLTNVTIGTRVTSIGDYAFIQCSDLTSVIIPNSVTSIGFEAFYGCGSIISVTIPDSMTSIGTDAFNNCSSISIVTIIANGGDANNVKQMMITAGVPENITWA